MTDRFGCHLCGARLPYDPDAVARHFLTRHGGGRRLARTLLAALLSTIRRHRRP